MNLQTTKTHFRTALAVALTLASVGTAFAANDPRSMTREAQQTLQTFTKADPSLSRRLSSVPAYAVIPKVGKGGIGVGGAYGSGILFERGHAIGKVSLTQVTVGLQLGGQQYSELILFQNQQTLDQFKRSNFALSAQMSAVAAAEGASANARFVQGVAVFTFARGGLMYEATVGGQKFNYTPFTSRFVSER